MPEAVDTNRELDIAICPRCADKSLAATRRCELCDGEGLVSVSVADEEKRRVRRLLAAPWPEDRERQRRLTVADADREGRRR